MGTALYRQYRSTSFDEVIGQEHITSTLKNSLANGSVAHAYLLTGPRGVGKTSIARILAYAVNDLPYDKDGIHLDIIEIDAASNRRIDEIRALRERVHIAPSSAKYKVYIIDEVHMLTREAFNALLKTLEEPPQHVIFILATTEIHKLPDTIVSRCITFTFRPIDTQSVVKHLKHIAKQEKLAISDDALELLAIHGEGSFRDSISLLDQIKNIQSDKIERADIELALGVAPDSVIDSIIAAITSGSAPSLDTALNQAYIHGASETNLAKQLAASIRSELSKKDSRLSSVMAIQLLKALLDVPGSPKPRAALELSLLDTLFTVKPIAGTVPAAPQPVLAPQPDHVAAPIPKPAPEPIKEPEVVFEVAVEIPPAIEETPVVAAGIPIDAELWDEILTRLKKKNNTLYGIARMAEAQHSDDTLTIIFKFAFHYKQINQPKNKALLLSVLDEIGKKDLQLEISLVDSKTKVAPTPAPKKDDISNITDIFGSGEVLES